MQQKRAGHAKWSSKFLTFASLFAFPFLSAVAQQTAFTEQAKLIKAPTAVTTLGIDLFGDKVNLYTGALEFIQTDVSLPGNSTLPVSVGRRLVAGREAVVGALFGGWDLEIPHLHGIFASSTGWVNINKSANRCSAYSEAPEVSTPNSGAIWSGSEYWHGNFMYIPGLGDQEMLRREQNYKSAPSNATGTYPIVTRNNWSIKCLSKLASGDAGEGFIAISPDGTTYQFDWMVRRRADPLIKNSLAPANISTPSQPDYVVESNTTLPLPGTSNIIGTPQLDRVEVWILPTKVTDKFGNTVTYTYDTTNKWQLKTIVGNDVSDSSRTLTLTYQTPGATTSNLVSSVSDGTRTWKYSYDATSLFAQLQTVTLPDQSKWSLGDIKSLLFGIEYLGNSSCEDPGVLGSPTRTGTMTHPAGAVGQFTVTPIRHGRTQVEKDCQYAPMTESYFVRYPYLFDTYALSKKELSGGSIGTMLWVTEYSAAQAGWTDCTTCETTKTVTVTDPAGDKTAYTFGTAWRETEGQLQRTDIISSSDVTLRSTALRYTTPIPSFGASMQPRGDGDMAAKVFVVDRREITQQNATFTWEATAFDAYARPTQVTRSSSLGYQRRETITYENNISKWVLGQTKQIQDTDSGRVIVSNVYDPTNATLTSVTQFGSLQRAMLYNTDGTISSVADGKGQATTYASYKRGVPQTVTYPAEPGKSALKQSAVVNNIGKIDSLTDENGYTTTFQYDAIGRLKSITHPGADSVAWKATTIDVAPSPTSAFDLPAGHWRQLVQTGDAYAVTHYDAMLRPAWVERYDGARRDATIRIVKYEHDFNGRATFESYPKRSETQTGSGKHTSYDALGRVTEIRTPGDGANELYTTYTYETGFRTTTTDARNNATTYSYQAFDEPVDNAIAAIVQPEGVSVTIGRDVFGKPTSIQRTGNNVTVTRSYVYDSKERLCKTIEPETGATLQDYDDANNIAWRASGTDLSKANACDGTTVPAARKAVHTYDKRNRLTRTAFGDASPAIDRTYTPDGLPASVKSGTSTWTYGYNKRRLLELESLVYGTTTFNIRRAYDVHGSLSSLTYPGDTTAVTFDPNALGEPQQVGSYATNVSYHPNGAIAGFRYGNGIVRTMEQTARGLPWTAVDAGVLSDKYSYDENGNVLGIEDLQAGVTTRTMSYDGLDRLKTVSAPNLWGLATYGYDAQDNLTSTSITSGANVRNATHAIDPQTHRLSSVTSTNANFNFSYGYDVQGNITKRGARNYVFDIANRMSSATGLGTYEYDGHGRRVSVVGNDGVNRIQVYSQDGKLLYTTAGAASATKYIYLHNHVIAEVK